MMHRTRRCVADVAFPEELANMLTRWEWTLCTGFRHRGYLYLNDGDPGEFAIVREADMAQVESITFGWCSREEAQAHIERITTGGFTICYAVVTCPIEAPQEHGSCGHCA